MSQIKSTDCSGPIDGMADEPPPLYSNDKLSIRCLLSYFPRVGRDWSCSALRALCQYSNFHRWRTRLKKASWREGRSSSVTSQKTQCISSANADPSTVETSLFKPLFRWFPTIIVGKPTISFHRRMDSTYRVIC